MQRLARFLLVPLLLWTGLACPALAGSAAEPQVQARPASAADDPLAELARKLRAEPDALTYAQLSVRVAREIYPGLNDEKAAAFEQQLAAEAEKLKKETEGLAPSERVERINRVLYRDWALKTPQVFAAEKEQPCHYFPHAVLEKKEGVCLGLTCVYLALGEKAGLPVRAAHAPQHIYVLYGAGKDALSVETTDGGRTFTLEAYMARNRFGKETQERLKVFYFKPLGKLEVLGDLLNAAAWCSAIGTAEKPLSKERTVLAAQLCVELGPGDYSNLDTLAEALSFAGRHREALEVFKRALDLRPPDIGPYNADYWDKRLKRFTQAIQTPP